MRTVFIALRALVFATGFFLVWGWVALGVRVYDRRLGIVLPEVAVGPGIVLMALGALLALTCVGVFVVEGRGTAAPFDAPRQFVARGPYRYLRNPMYVGGWVLLVGFGLYQRSAAILVFSVVWIGLAHLFVILYEEPNLRRRFGAAYENYCKAVPRWILRSHLPGK